MTNPIKLAEFRLMLDACCGPVAKQSRRLTGLEKESLALVDPLELIQDEYDKEFGGQL